MPLRVMKDELLDDCDKMLRTVRLFIEAISNSLNSDGHIDSER
jgi:hypothetical protein